MNSGVKFPLYKKIILPPIDNNWIESKDFPTYISALKSARNGDIDAAFYVSQHPATSYLHHTSCFWLLKAAKGGQTHAQFKIGKAYYYKNHTDSWTFKDRNKKDVDKAKFWLKKSADAGCLDAEFFLASINRDKAVIEELAKQGNFYSRFYMGVLYLDTDMSKAFNWFNQVFEKPYLSRYSWLNKLASKDRNMHAQYNMGVMYDNGLGVKINKKKAFDCYFDSAHQGLPMAKNNLGVMFAEGEISTGVNMTQARKWIKRALETDMSDSGIPLANWQKYAI